MTPDQQIQKAWFELQVSKLIRDARRNGMVITVTLEPTQPLRVGGYEMVADVRPTRGRVCSCIECLGYEP